MISYDRLAAAAETASALLLAEAERGFNPDDAWEPSARFQRKLRPVRRRADHPYFYRSMRHAAGFFLAILIAGSTWVAVDMEARAAVSSWIKGIFGSFFVYQADGGGVVTEIGPDTYRPAWLPEGYVETSVTDLGTSMIVRYENAEGKKIRFVYSNGSTESSAYLDMRDITLEHGIVNGEQADLLISSNPEISSGIVWTVYEDNMTFEIAAFLDRDELIHMAESVVEQ